VLPATRALLSPRARALSKWIGREFAAPDRGTPLQFCRENHGSDVRGLREDAAQRRPPDENSGYSIVLLADVRGRLSELLRRLGEYVGSKADLRRLERLQRRAVTRSPAGRKDNCGGAERTSPEGGGCRAAAEAPLLGRDRRTTITRRRGEAVHVPRNSRQTAAHDSRRNHEFPRRGPTARGRRGPSA